MTRSVSGLTAASSLYWRLAFRASAVALACLLPVTGWAAEPFKTKADLANFLIWNIEQPIPAEKQFRDAMTAYAPDSPEYAEISTQLARALGLQQKFKEAHALLDALEPRLGSLPPIVAVRVHLERGRLFNSNHEQARAKPLFEQAWDEARASHHDYLAVDAAHMMAFVVPPEEQLAWNKKALDYAEASTAPRAKRWLASLYNNVGMAYQDMGKYDDALAAFDRALVERQKMDEPSEVAVARWMIAHVHRLMGRNDEALAEQLALEKAMLASGDIDGYVYEELAELYLAKDDKKQAKHYAGLAYDELSTDIWLVRDEPERLARLKRLSEEN
ncbi:MAG: tetratricopeptide repeat protein [Burkholderiales bacterium]|nr:tetratricopeptide repeat protein [Burkholderiales bacterium]